MSAADDGLESLKHFVGNAKYTNVLVLADAAEDAPPLIQRLTLDEKVANEFRDVALAVFERMDGELRPFDPGYKPEIHEVCWMSLSQAPDVAAMVADLSDVNEAELFEEDDEIVDRLRLYTIVVGDAKKQALFLRSYSPQKELTRRRGFALMLKSGAYNFVKSRVFLFDKTVDCIAWGGILYILNVVQFQRMFRYFEALKDTAEQALAGIAKQIPIANLDEFKAACLGHTLMMAKLAALAQKPYMDRIKMSDVKKTITAFKLPIEMKRAGGTDALVFQGGREQRWLILKLLDDDYLGSIMTQEKYEVNSKLPRST